MRALALKPMSFGNVKIHAVGGQKVALYCRVTGDSGGLFLMRIYDKSIISNQ
jgi:hypothetical protein